jgi:guanylate kinase
VPTRPVFVVTGPSGAGKGTLIKGLLERVEGLQVAVSATTRPQRPGEVDGRDYWFLSDDEFSRRVDAGDFLEWVPYVSGRRYGTLRTEIDRIAEDGCVCVLELELEGALEVQEEVPRSVTIFIAAPVRVPVHGAQRRRRPRDDDPHGHRRGRDRASSYHGRPMIYPRLDDLLEQVDGSRYALVLVAAKRARQINNYHHQLGEGIGFDEAPPPLIESRSKNYLTMAMEEIASGKIKHLTPPG